LTAEHERVNRPNPPASGLFAFAELEKEQSIHAHYPRTSGV
jgi:hypothetical protein